MKKTIVAGLFALLCLVATPSARAAENWCLRNFGDPPGKSCVSAPLDYCLRGLAAGGGADTVEPAPHDMQGIFGGVEQDAA